MVPETLRLAFDGLAGGKQTWHFPGAGVVHHRRRRSVLRAEIGIPRFHMEMILAKQIPLCRAKHRLLPATFEIGLGT